MAAMATIHPQGILIIRLHNDLLRSQHPHLMEVRFSINLIIVLDIHYIFIKVLEVQII